MSKVQHVLTDWRRPGASDTDPNFTILPQHAALAVAERARVGFPPGLHVRVAYRWTALTAMPLYSADGEIPPSADEPVAMQRARQPGTPVPPSDWADVIEATGYGPADGWKLYIMVPVF